MARPTALPAQVHLSHPSMRGTTKPLRASLNTAGEKWSLGDASGNVGFHTSACLLDGIRMRAVSWGWFAKIKKKTAKS